MWPFSKQENRASYTEAAIQYILTQAADGVTQADVRATSAAQTAAGLIARSLSIAVPSPSLAVMALSAPVLYDVGRAFVLDGEAVYLIAVLGGRMTLVRASDWDIRDAGPVWRYRLTLPGATATRTVDVPGEAVFHPRVNVSREQPARGHAMIRAASYTARLLAALEVTLGNEAEAPSGNVLPAPLDTLGDEVAELKNDLRGLKGRTALVPSMADKWGEGRAGAPARDWQQQRIGGNPPDVLRALWLEAEASVLASAGIPPTLFSTRGEATGAREALRQFLHSTLQPLGDLIAAEATAKFGAPVSLSFDRLFAADIQGRARAFQSLVAGGMAIAEAAAASGILQED